MNHLNLDALLDLLEVAKSVEGFHYSMSCGEMGSHQYSFEKCPVISCKKAVAAIKKAEEPPRILCSDGARCCVRCRARMLVFPSGDWICPNCNIRTGVENWKKAHPDREDRIPDITPD